MNLTPAQQMRDAAYRLLEEAEEFEAGAIWNGEALDLAVEVLARLDPRP